jgi:predicted nucleic acid-binding protein
LIVIDTSVIYALLDRRDNNHEQAAAWYLATRPALATTPLVLAEVDHLAGTRAGSAALDAWRRDLANGVYDVLWWPGAAAAAVEVAARYADLEVGMTDASLVTLAARLETTNVATFDERHFRAMEPLGAGRSFRILPQDA